MSPRSLKLLAGALAALGGVWALASFLQRPAPPAALWPGAADAVKLRLERAGETVVLEKSSDTWRLTEPFAFPADGGAVAELLDKLAKAELSEPLADGRARDTEFSLGASSGIRVAGWTPGAAEPALRAGFGKPGARYDSVLARLPGSDSIYEVRGVERYALDRGAGRWADRLVCALDQARIASLELKTHRTTVRLRQEGGRWFAGGAREPLAEEALRARYQRLLTALARLEADEVRPDRELHPFVRAALATPQYRLLVRSVAAGVADGGELVLELSIGPKKPGFNHPARKAGVEGVYYELAGWRVEDFDVEPR